MTLPEYLYFNFQLFMFVFTELKEVKNRAIFNIPLTLLREFVLRGHIYPESIYKFKPQQNSSSNPLT